ncbi:Pseudouridine synthase I TruA [Penicillium atrosanguineum]|nr:Pseudouridine synthase I TruA [Penicillium atrosanguineum]
MRAFAISRPFAGVFSLRSPITAPLTVRSNSRTFHNKSNPRIELSEFFNRVQWPTTKAEKAELVEGVRTAIWEGQNGDKRERTERQAEAKRRKIENGEEVKAPIYATEFTKEEIANEERRPKKKVALMMGYSGTGYYGMQLNENQKTIEGDLFAALVATGAISKANASDPKKSSFVRCARTDKGVHAAGNVVSLKMIIDDPDIVQKINDKLSPQIRVWGFEHTTGGFSCYQLCDSRIYDTYIGKKIVEFAEKKGDLDAVNARQADVEGYWADVDKKYIKPILESVPEDIRQVVEKSLYLDEESKEPTDKEEEEEQTPAAPENIEEPTTEKKPFVMDPRQRKTLDTIKAIKAAYTAARRTYRAPPSRVARLQEALDQYVGTKNFHNYTIQKTHKDPSAKRHIKSFNVNPNPILINGTEWLSLKVHGQSFMMHQIRKMVAMATLVVRSGCPADRIEDTYGPHRIAIPKAPGLGLLLERPIFDSYNQKAEGLGRERVAFDKFTKEMEEFKQREIYDRIFREEEESAAFGSFFNHIDHFPGDYFLYVTSGGVEAAEIVAAPNEKNAEKKEAEQVKTGKSQKEALAEVESGSEDEANLAGGEEGN